jgi:hypothetical protein
VARHPIKGKPIRGGAATVYSFLAVLAAHLIFTA